jgi:hypothetical protein
VNASAIAELYFRRQAVEVDSVVGRAGSLANRKEPLQGLAAYREAVLGKG